MCTEKIAYKVAHTHKISNLFNVEMRREVEVILSVCVCVSRNREQKIINIKK